MTKKERERLIKDIDRTAAEIIEHGLCGWGNVCAEAAAELRRTSDYDELKARLDAAWKLVAPVGQMYAICASALANALAATSERRADASALDIPYADPGIEVGATTHRRVK